MRGRGELHFRCVSENGIIGTALGMSYRQFGLGVRELVGAALELSCTP